MIREIPQLFTPYFIKICAFCKPLKTEDLYDYMVQTRTTFLQKLEVIDKTTMLNFMKGLSERLEARDIKWMGKIE